MRRCLVGEIQNLAKEAVQASTGTAEHYDVIVKLVEDKILLQQLSLQSLSGQL